MNELANLNEQKRAVLIKSLLNSQSFSDIANHDGFKALINYLVALQDENIALMLSSGLKKSQRISGANSANTIERVMSFILNYKRKD